MKTSYNHIKLSLALSLIMAISLSASATERLEVNTDLNSRVVNMKMVNPASETMDLALINDRDRIIFQEKIENAGNFEQSYDLSGHEDGVYTLVLERENIKFHRVLEVRGSGVTISDSYYTFKPVFKIDGNKVLVHYINNGQREIGISIEQGSKTLFDTYYGDNEQIFSEAFDLRNLANGNYTLNFVTQGEFHAFEFEVD